MNAQDHRLMMCKHVLLVITCIVLREGARSTTFFLSGQIVLTHQLADVVLQKQENFLESRQLSNQVKCKLEVKNLLSKMRTAYDTPLKWLQPL